MNENFGLIFLVISNAKNLTGELINVQKVFWQKLEVITSFLLHLSVCWKHKILKKRQLSREKKIFGLFFSRFIECDKSQRTTYKGAQGFLTITVEFIGPFL